MASFLRRRDWPWLAAALLALLVVFWPALGHRATSLDDEAVVFANPVQQHFGWPELREAFDPTASRIAYGLQYTPLRDLSHALDVRLFGARAGWHHLQSIVLHGAATLALFVLVRRLGGPPIAAGVAALLFALHPLQVEAVAWISGRTVPLAGALALWALVAWGAFCTDGGRSAWWLALLLFVAANLAKQSAVMVVGMLAVVDWAVARGRAEGWRSRAGAYLPFVVLAIGFTMLGLAVARREGIVPPVERTPGESVRLSFAALGWYAATLVRPVGLLPAYHLDAPPGWGQLAVWRGLATALVGVAGVALSGRRLPLIATGLLVAGLAVLPGVHGLGTQVVADRYAYLVVAGAAIACGAVAEVFARRAAAPAMALVGVVVVLLGVTASRRVAVWHDDLALYGDALATEPQRPLWAHMYGRALNAAGRSDQAEAVLAGARERNGGPVAGYCPLPPVLTEIALQRERDGDVAAAEATLMDGFEQARPGEVDRAAVDLGAFYLRHGDRGRARLVYLHATDRDPDATPLAHARLEWIDGLRDEAASAALPDGPARAHNPPMAGQQEHSGRTGMIYREPQDTRLVVPKRIGYGWTINFAHPWAIPALLGAFALAVGPGLTLVWSGAATPLRLVLIEGASIAALIALAMRAAKG